MQNHRIPYTTATWGMVEDASEPAPFLSVAANRHTTMDAYFCVVRATKFTKNIKKIEIIEYYMVRRHGTACQSLRWRLPACETQW